MNMVWHKDHREVTNIDVVIRTATIQLMNVRTMLKRAVKGQFMKVMKVKIQPWHPAVGTNYAYLLIFLLSSS